MRHLQKELPIEDVIDREKYRDARLLVTSGDELPPPLPDGARFMPKPWTPLDLLREASAIA